MILGEQLITPGFVDFHTHLRDPSTNHAETMCSGTLAAAMGGYVLVKDMPNNPGMPVWSEEAMRAKHARVEAEAVVYVGCAAGSQPEFDNIGELEAMAPLALDLKLYGAPTTGNHNDYEASDFREIVEEWHRVAPDKPIGLHAGKNNLEDMIGLVAIDNGQHLHVCHVSSQEEVNQLIRAKKRGLSVTGGVTPHHLLKSSFDTNSEGWFARMQPPLAKAAIAESLMWHLAKGDIDIIETDHAPHFPSAKLAAETQNPDGIHDEHHTTCFGVEGIEFAFPLMAYQVYRGNITMERVIDAMSTKPAEILGVTVDPRTTTAWDIGLYRIDNEKASVTSCAGWTPFLGKMAAATIFNNEVKGEAIAGAHGERFTVIRGSRVVSERGTVI